MILCSLISGTLKAKCMQCHAIDFSCLWTIHVEPIYFPCESFPSHVNIQKSLCNAKLFYKLLFSLRRVIQQCLQFVRFNLLSASSTRFIFIKTEISLANFFIPSFTCMTYSVLSMQLKSLQWFQEHFSSDETRSGWKIEYAVLLLPS